MIVVVLAQSEFEVEICDNLAEGVGLTREKNAASSYSYGWLGEEALKLVMTVCTYTKMVEGDPRRVLLVKFVRPVGNVRVMDRLEQWATSYAEAGGENTRFVRAKDFGSLLS